METFATSPLHRPVKRPIRRVALACVQCRGRKVRCDATQPACNRCRGDEKECEYLKSRRGGRPRRPNPSPFHVAPVRPRLPHETPADLSYKSDSNSSSRESLQSPTSRSLCDSVDMHPSKPQADSPLGNSHMDHLLTLYYANFHVSHPCILPRWALEASIAVEEGISGFLLPVLFYIGSIFTHSIDSAPFASSAADAMKAGELSPSSIMPSPYFIQALMLYSIATYWCGDRERGRQLLDECIDGAFLLGMHQKHFASQYGNGDPTLEESWRRTWWQIHVTDIHIAGSLHSFQGLSVKFPITAELPCEEQNYETGIIPTPASLQHYDAREFSDVEFSSFAHLIGFTQGISRVLTTRRYNDPDNARATCAKADTMMTAWCSLLPANKQRLFRDDGGVDELLFKATILMHTYTVDLHRQLSSLQYSAVESISNCAPPPPLQSMDSLEEDKSIHTARVLSAVGRLNNLLTLPTNLSIHTPFIICMIANMTIAHLSACRYIFRDSKLSLEREKIRLNMGVLKMLGEFWPTGRREYKIMGTIAKEILALKEEEIQIPKETPISPLDTVPYGFPDIYSPLGHDDLDKSQNLHSFELPAASHAQGITPTASSGQCMGILGRYQFLF